MSSSRTWRPVPSQALWRRMAYGCSYGCLSAAVLLCLLPIGWRLLASDSSAAQPPAKRAGTTVDGMSSRAVESEPVPDGKRDRLGASLAGQLPSFHVESSGTMLGDLAVENLVLDATEVEFNVRGMLGGEKAQISSFRSARVSLRISQQALRTKLVPLLEQQGLKDASILFGNNTVKITGKRKFKLLGSIKLSATGRFEVVGDSSVGLRITELESGQLNIGTSSLKLDFRQAIPPLNLGGMYARVVIDRLDLDANGLAVSAHAVPLNVSEAPAGALDIL